MPEPAILKQSRVALSELVMALPFGIGAPAAFSAPFAPATEPTKAVVPEPISCQAASASASVFAVAAL